MNLQQIKEIARQRDLTVGKMNKSDSIRAIQEKEGNFPCFKTDKADECGQANCLWREDCQ
jgi:hypothetical protein